MNGFCRNATPPSSMPWRSTASPVYPDIKSTFMPGRFSARLCISLYPLMPGMTISVMKQVDMIGGTLALPLVPRHHLKLQ